jgi:CheY-like chemotaxis protein/signal transduction histidine kinase
MVDGADPVLDRVVEQASELLHAPKVGLAVIEPGDAGPVVLRFVATRGLSQQFAQNIRPTHWRDGTTAIAIHERRPVWSADLLNDPNVDLTESTRRAVEVEGYRAVLSVPLLGRDHVIGALVLYRDEAGPFSPEAVELAQVFATQAAVAIENARLYRRAEDRATKLHALSALTQLIQNFTGTRRARPPGRVALGDVVREVVQLTRVRWKDEAQRRGVPYEVTVEGDVPTVAGHADELREVFTNLLNNALDSMPDGGRCAFRLASNAGMATVGIVSSSGGTIHVHSTPGAGTRLTVQLPIPAALPDEPGGTVAPAPAPTARVLVIDDDETVRQVLADMLQEMGLAPSQAAGGPDGLDLCATERFDLVITDLSMPEMSGWEVAAALAKDHPGVIVAMVTGWGEQVDSGQAARHHLKFVLAKPFSLDDVVRAVGAALEGA